MPLDDRDLKRAALIGLRHERHRMDELVLRLERELGVESATTAPTRRKRRISAAGRANIVAALKKRWAAVRKAKAESKPPAAAKPKPAQRKGAAKAPAKAVKRAAAKAVAKRTAGAAKASPPPAKRKVPANRKRPVVKPAAEPGAPVPIAEATTEVV